MLEMSDWHKLELNHSEHAKDLLREVERQQWVRLALAQRDHKRHLFGRMLLWLGDRLVAWGQLLQQRFAAERPNRLRRLDATREPAGTYYA